MKHLPIAILLAFAATPALAGTIAASQASAHVGQNATVEGVVAEVHTARSGKVTFIDMGGHYPDNPFTGVVFARSMAAVGDLSKLPGRIVDITGTIQSYEGRPEIIVSARSQIKVK